MRTFTDDAGREWSLKITPLAIKDLRTALGIDLTSWESPPFERLAASPELLVDVLWFLVKGQQPDVTERDFAGAMGDAVDAATLALMEAANDSFHTSKRSLRRSLLEKTAAVAEKAGQLALAKLDDPRLLERFSRDMDQVIATSLAPSSASPSTTSATESATASPDETPSLRAFG